MPRGLFITLEGGEGAGKSTHAAALVEWLRERDRTPIMTREPGGSPLAEAVRELFLSGWDEGIDGKTETLLLFAARAAHVRSTIEPALTAGQDVVCDRFVDASYAYQGAGRGVPDDVLTQLENWVLGPLRPDVTFVLDLDPRIGLERTQRRGEQNRFEAETCSFMARVRAAYLRRAQDAPDRCVVIDAGQAIAEIQHQMRAVLAPRL